MLEKSFTKHAAEREFHIWNNILFKNSIVHIPTFRICEDLDDGETDGYFIENEDEESATIKISKRAAREYPEAFSVILIHEMVHLLQWQEGLDVDHDDYFNSKCDEIEKLIGWDVK